MRTELAGDALRTAARDRASLAGAIFHSDHGSVYASKAYAALCEQLKVVQSMGAVGTIEGQGPQLRDSQSYRLASRVCWLNCEQPGSRAGHHQRGRFARTTAK